MHVMCVHVRVALRDVAVFARLRYFSSLLPRDIFGDIIILQLIHCKAKRGLRVPLPSVVILGGDVPVPRVPIQHIMYNGGGPLHS